MSGRGGREPQYRARTMTSSRYPSREPVNSGDLSLSRAEMHPGIALRGRSGNRRTVCNHKGHDHGYREARQQVKPGSPTSRVMVKEPVRETEYVSEEGAQESSTQGTIETDRQMERQEGKISTSVV